MIQSGTTGMGVGDSGWNLYGGSGPRHSSAKIKFPTTFLTVPKVIVQLHQVDVIRGDNHRVNVKASNITPTSFDVEFHTWSGTQVYSLGVTWIAYDESGDAIGPNSLAIYDKGLVNYLYSYRVLDVFENQIYGVADGQTRMRVLAFLYPEVLRTDVPNKTCVLCLCGSRVDDINPSEHITSIRFTDNYTIKGTGKTEVEFQKHNSNRNVTRHFIKHHESQRNIEVFWGYDLTDSVILGRPSEADERLRITSLLVPGVLRESDINLFGTPIRAFGYKENAPGKVEFYNSIALIDKKFKNLQWVSEE